MIFKLFSSLKEILILRAKARSCCWGGQPSSQHGNGALEGIRDQEGVCASPRRS